MFESVDLLKPRLLKARILVKGIHSAKNEKSVIIYLSS